MPDFAFNNSAIVPLGRYSSPFTDSGKDTAAKVFV